jgi:hypothetical protein
MSEESRVVLRRSAAAGTLLLAAVSLAGWGPLRRAEQTPAALLRPLEELVDTVLPARAPDEEATLQALVSDARLAWEGWQQAVLRDGPPAAPGLAALPATVVARDLARRELAAVVPSGCVRPGAPATHRRMLVGFVTELRVGPELGTDLAIVAPLGRHDLRAVAGQWQPGAGARPIEVLVGPSEAGDDPHHPALSLLARTSSVAPPPDQLCWTRDVSSLGDSLPAGLLLGRLEGARDEQPGGAARLRLGDELCLRPLADPFSLELLAIAGVPAAPRKPRRLDARLMATSHGRRTARLDAGTRAGVREGDWVSQDGLYLGRVTTVTGGSALVDLAPPAGPLLCVTRDGEVRVLGLQPESWPSGWQPARGDLLALGRPGIGGLLVGLVAAADEDGLRLERPAPDDARGVTVSGP